jgi:hypothetical protein
MYIFCSDISTKFFTPALFSAILFSLCSSVFASEKNGFELSGALIPESQIFGGGPGKDGIPAIDNPVFIPASIASNMKNTDLVLGIEIGGISRAYPINILNWHEIVNDKIGREQFSITFCPLCGTGMAFSGRINGYKLDFGVSGLLYNSDVLLYDRQTGSLWSQIMQQAVTGKLKGTKLKSLPVQHTTWANWINTHPDTKVLSFRTGYLRPYKQNPYGDYVSSPHLYFPVYEKAPEIYHPKEQVLGIEIGGIYKAYPFIELNKTGKSSFNDTVNKQTVTIHWNEKHQSGTVTDKSKQLLSVVQGFWFAWYAFHPDTLVYKAPNK